MNKLNNFPPVNFINLHESVDRRLFMNSQFTQYGLEARPYYTDRYAVFKDQIEIRCEVHCDYQQGNNISYLNALRRWYDTTNEDYGFFCDDDISFETVDYWPFTWQEFLDNLPADWECVQLIRINVWDPGMKNYGVFEIPSLQLRTRGWNDYGCAAIFKRDYVKKLLDRHWIDGKVYDFTIRSKNDPNYFYYPIVESLLYREISDNVYNFPLLLENQTFDSTVHFGDEGRAPHTRSYELYSTLWKLFGSELPLSYMMNKS